MRKSANVARHLAKRACRDGLVLGSSNEPENHHHPGHEFVIAGRYRSSPRYMLGCAKDGEAMPAKRSSPRLSRVTTSSFERAQAVEVTRHD
jgi:hypothetical protein